MLFATIQGRGPEDLNQGSGTEICKVDTNSRAFTWEIIRSEVQLNVMIMRKGDSKEVPIIDHSQIKNLGSKCLETLVFWI